MSNISNMMHNDKKKEGKVGEKQNAQNGKNKVFKSKTEVKHQDTEGI